MIILITQSEHLLLKHKMRDFSGGSVLKEPTCQCRRHGLDPWSGNTPHALGQLSLRTATTETAHRTLRRLLHRAWEQQLMNSRAATSQACALQQEKPPHHN